MKSMQVANLADLHPGQSGVIQAIQAEELLHHRLQALGFRLGKKVEVIRHSKFSGPIQVRIGTTEVMMRLREARLIHITPQ